MASGIEKFFPKVEAGDAMAARIMWGQFNAALASDAVSPEVKAKLQAFKDANPDLIGRADLTAEDIKKIDALKQDVAPAPAATPAATPAAAVPRPVAPPVSATRRRPLSAPPAVAAAAAPTGAPVTPVMPASPEQKQLEMFKKAAVDIKSAMRTLRESAGLQHAAVQKQFPAYNQFYGAVRSFENRLAKRESGEVVADTELFALMQAVREHFTAFKNEVSAAPAPVDGGTKPTLGARFAALLRRNEKDVATVVTSDTSAAATPEQKQWEQTAALKKEWKEKQRAFYEQHLSKSVGQDVRTLGFSAWRRNSAKKEYDAAKQAYMAALAPQLQYRESREQRTSKLRDGSYRPYFAQRFVLDEGNLLLEKQTEFLSPKKRELVAKLQEKLKKNRTAIRVGVVAVTALAAGTGAAVAGIGLGAALGVGALAGAGKSARMLVSAGSAALVGSHVFSVLDARVDRKKDDLTRSMERTQRRSYEDLMNNHDALINEYTDKYDKYRGAQTTRTVGTVAAAVGTGALVGSQFDSIVDAIDKLDFLFSVNDPHLVNVLPGATDKAAGFAAPENLPVAESLNIETPTVDNVPDEVALPELQDEPLPDTVMSETPDLPVVTPELESPVVPEVAPEVEVEPLSPLTDPAAPELPAAPEPVVPSADAPIPETGSEDAVLAPGGLDGSVVQAETVENHVGSMLEDLPLNVYEVHSGDPGVSYELVKQYPDLFKDLSRDEWNDFINQVNAEPQLLQAAGIESGDLNTIFDGNQVRLDLLAEFKLNGQVSEHLSAVETSPVPLERPVGLTATESAPTESIISPARPNDLGVSEFAPETSPVPPERPGDLVPEIEAVPDAPLLDVAPNNMAGPDYAALPVQPAVETTVVNASFSPDETPQWASAAESTDTTVPVDAAPLPESITTAAAGVELPAAAQEALGRMGEADQAEFADRLADNPNLTPDQITAMANVMAARVEAVAYFNTISGIETGHGLDAVGYVKVAELQQVIANNQLPKFLADHGVTNTAVAETISLMQECRLLQPGMNLNQALERAFMENNMRFNETGDELVILKAGLFGPKEFEVALANQTQQYA